jgi:hypothetical protein
MSVEVTAVMIELPDRDGPAAVELLRQIVAAHAVFMDRNENGSHDEFQRAANAFYDAIDAAEGWLVARGTVTQLPVTGGE